MRTRTPTQQSELPLDFGDDERFATHNARGEHQSELDDLLGDWTRTLTSAELEAVLNADIAQVQVQNKLQVATATLPTLVQQLGVRVTKASSGFLMVVSFVSTDGQRDVTDLSDFVASSVLDSLAPREATEFLIDKARSRARGGGDNLSLVVVRIEALAEEKKLPPLAAALSLSA